MSFAALMVHLDVEHDCEPRVQLALDLAHRFQAGRIGIAGMALRPAFAAGGVVVYHEPTEHDRRTVTARFEEMGKKFRTQGQHLEEVEWRTALELPSDLVVREARAADLIIVGPTRMGANVHDTWSSPASSCCGRDVRSWSCPTRSPDCRCAASWWRARTRGSAGARWATRFLC
jgi:hypothetical protein